MTATIAPSINTVSATSLSPVLSTEQKELQDQIGNSGTFKKWFSGAWESMKSFFSKAGEWLNSRRDTAAAWVARNEWALPYIHQGAEMILARPEVQDGLKKAAARLSPEVAEKVMDPAVQKELVNAAIDVGLKVPGADAKFAELKAKYGPIVMEEAKKIGTNAMNSVIGLVLKNATSAIGSVRDSFGSTKAPAANPV